jgi:hypothetical protein
VVVGPRFRAPAGGLAQRLRAGVQVRRCDRSRLLLLRLRVLGHLILAAADLLDPLDHVGRQRSLRRARLDLLRQAVHRALDLRRCLLGGAALLKSRSSSRTRASTRST